MNFLKLDVWKRSTKISVDVYKYFERHRDFGFRDQITRASLSVPSNITEGTERKSDRDTRHYYNIAKSSCGELFTQTYVGMEIGYIEETTGKLWHAELKEISAMLGGLIRRLDTHLN